MNAVPLDDPQQMLFALLRLALWNKVPDKALFENVSEAIWDKVFHLSVGHGISAIVVDGIALLPEELQPPRSIKLTWIINAEKIESEYERKLSIANEIAAIFTQNNIQMMIFKGIGLAQFYPIPKHREFLDIDFYLFGKQAEGDRLLLQSGAKKRHSIDKHSELIYKGILLENHNYFLAEEFNHVLTLEKYLQRTLTNGKFSSNLLVNKALTPPPNFDILFILCHSFWHYSFERLFLRHLCDWAVLLKANIGNIDFKAYREIITKCNLTNFADALTALAIQYLGLDPELAPPFHNNPEVGNRMMRESLKPYIRQNFEGLSLSKIVRLKIDRLKSKKWRYDEFMGPGSFYKVIGHSIIFHICHPKSVTK